MEILIWILVTLFIVYKILGKDHPIVKSVFTEGVIKYEDGTINYANGEIVHKGICKANGEQRIGQRSVGCLDGYDYIWVYVGNGNYKVISKTKE